MEGRAGPLRDRPAEQAAARRDADGERALAATALAAAGQVGGLAAAPSFQGVCGSHCGRPMPGAGHSEPA
jgi:hypothetical protein